MSHASNTSATQCQTERIGPPKISHFATLEWQKMMLEAKRRLNFDTEMQQSADNKSTYISGPRAKMGLWVGTRLKCSRCNKNDI